MKYLLVTVAAMGAFAAAPAFAETAKMSSSSDGMGDMTCEEFNTMDSDAQMEAMNMFGSPSDPMESDATGGADPGTMPDASGGGQGDSGDMAGAGEAETMGPSAADIAAACAENPEMMVEEAAHEAMGQ